MSDLQPPALGAAAARGAGRELVILFPLEQSQASSRTPPPVKNSSFDISNDLSLGRQQLRRAECHRPVLSISAEWCLPLPGLSQPLFQLFSAGFCS